MRATESVSQARSGRLQNGMKNTHEDGRHQRLGQEVVGPCTHDPKAAREPYEALVRAIAYQQLTAKALPSAADGKGLPLTT